MERKDEFGMSNVNVVGYVFIFPWLRGFMFLH